MSWISSFRSLFFSPSKPQSNILRAFYKSVAARQDISENPYFEKYKDKITKKMQNRPEDIEARLRENYEIIARNEYSPSKHIDAELLEMKYSNTILNQPKKDLNQVMILDMVKDKTAAEIETIWKQYHQMGDGVYAVIPGESYAKMEPVLKECPTFLFPLAREGGYEYILCQSHGNSVYFTTMIGYKAFKENAPVCFTVTYYTELLADKGIVLMRGEFDSRALKASEAQCLTNQLQLYYGSEDEEKLSLVRSFNLDPDNFDHHVLISNFDVYFA